jgi:hypothetical protein
MFLPEEMELISEVRIRMGAIYNTRKLQEGFIFESLLNLKMTYSIRNVLSR